MAKKKNRLPKKVGGFKVPKSVQHLVAESNAGNANRSGYGRPGDNGGCRRGPQAVLVQEREVIAETGAAVVKKGARKSKRAAGIATEMVQSAASAVMGVVADAVKNFTPEGHEGEKAQSTGDGALGNQAKGACSGLPKSIERWLLKPWGDTAWHRMRSSGCSSRSRGTALKTSASHSARPWCRHCPSWTHRRD